MSNEEAFIDRFVRDAMNHYGFRNREDLKRLVEELARRLYQAEHKERK